MRNVQTLSKPALRHTFYLEEEQIPMFETLLKNAKECGYFEGLTIEDIKYGINTHILCYSSFRMQESTLIRMFDICSGYELNVPISNKKSSQLS